MRLLSKILAGNVRRCGEYNLPSVRETMCVVIDDVWQLVEAEQWKNPKELPTCAMPHSDTFFEWQANAAGFAQIGVHTSCEDIGPQEADERWLLTHAVYYEKAGIVFGHGHISYSVLRNDGSLVAIIPGDEKGWSNETVAWSMAMPGVALFAAALMHCKNVTTRDSTKTEGPPVKWLRRMRVPEVRYHVLDIEPMRKVLRTEGGLEANGLKKALHICRGHFSTYTEDKPLFGRIAGTFWVPSHVRGSTEHGTVHKDYRVRV